MNFNNFPERFLKEEQKVMDELVSRMDKILDKLDSNIQKIILEARNTDISVNPDMYSSQITVQHGIKENLESKKEVIDGRDGLYGARLLIQNDDEYGNDIEEIKVGLHSCLYENEIFIVSWAMPLCRHYMLDNPSVIFEGECKDKFDEWHYTKCKLIAKNTIDLKFTKVKSAKSVFPKSFNVETLDIMKEHNFLGDEFLDYMIDKIQSGEGDYESDDIIADEFLRELAERRASAEFKNIVFSIQKKQGEIIQADYKRSFIVQGCAGSGKSMILLHRLPIVLYDKAFSRTNLYIITPSQMYIQLAENMRGQLEISDINMGTIEQYYDYCIGKYIGHKANEYGRKNYGFKLSKNNEKYIYSQKCIDDIIAYYESIQTFNVLLDKAYEIFSIKKDNWKEVTTYKDRINERVLELTNVINSNDNVLDIYYERIVKSRDVLNNLSASLRYRKNNLIREIRKRISNNKREIEIAKKELEELDAISNEKAFQNRINKIIKAENEINSLNEKISSINADEAYFNYILDLNKKINELIEPFYALKKEILKKELYEVIRRRQELIDGFYEIYNALSNIDDKYDEYIGSINNELDRVRKNISALKDTSDKYLDFEYYTDIVNERDKLTDIANEAIKKAYRKVMIKIGIKPDEKGRIGAIKCSSYIYLQALYCFQGEPNQKESLLAIDEAQGFAPEEIKLLKKVNGNSVIFNMYGDIHQHIEGTKGISSWTEYKKIIDYDYYEISENYRNASEITEYCNRTLNMNMNSINTPGRGTHELKTVEEFKNEMITQLMDNQRAGLAAILVKNDAEARALIDMFSSYKQKFHDMTDEEFSVHRTRWNIISIADAKGLEFSSVIVLSARMTKNERYIAFTRALDSLYIYSDLLDIRGFEHKENKDNIELNKSNITNKKVIDKNLTTGENHKEDEKIRKDHTKSEVRAFFEEKGLKVVDKRDQGSRLWVVGEKTIIRNYINEAIAKFGISGKYMVGKDIGNKEGWCTKTDK